MMMMREDEVALADDAADDAPEGRAGDDESNGSKGKGKGASAEEDRMVYLREIPCRTAHLRWDHMNEGTL